MRILVLLALLTITIDAVSQDVPRKISYQGILINSSNGEPLADDEYFIQFSFFAPENTSHVFQTGFLPVTTFKGLFTTVIDLQAMSPSLWSNNLTMVVNVSGITPSPTVELTSAPYSFFAGAAYTMNAAGLTGTIPNATLDEDLQDLSDGSLSGAKIGTGISGGNVGTGIKAANITDNSEGTIPLPMLPQDLHDLVSGNLNPELIPFGIDGSKINAGIDAENISSGTLNDARLSAHLQDLADGTLSPGLIDTGIDASKVTVGTLSEERITAISGSKISSGIKASNITDASGGLIDNTMLDLDLQDLADGNLDGAKIATGIDATNISSGTLDISRLPTSVMRGTGTTHQIATFTSGNEVAANTNLFWESTQNKFGINTLTPLAKLHIHQTGATSGVDSKAVQIRNQSNGTGKKLGIEIEVAPTTSGEIAGIRNTITSFSTGISYGIHNIVAGTSSSAHYGIRSETTGAGLAYGIYSLTSGTGFLSYGVYSSASGAANNYAIYSNGNLHTVGNISYTGSIGQGSDRKLKKEIKPIESALDKIRNLNPSTYLFRTSDFPSLNLSPGIQFGLIAQEVEPILPNLVKETTVDLAAGSETSSTAKILSYKTVDYVSLIPLLIKGMQEQQEMIEAQKDAIQTLTDEVNNLKSSTTASTGVSAAIKKD